MNLSTSQSSVGNRVINSLIQEQQNTHNLNFFGPNRLTNIGLPDKDNNLQMIQIADILYCESVGNTTNIYVENYQSRFIVFDSLKSFEERLGYFNFFRTHRSFLINLNKVLRYNYRKEKGRKIKMTNGNSVAVSDDKKKLLKKQLQLF